MENGDGMKILQTGTFYPVELNVCGRSSGELIKRGHLADPLFTFAI
jgi:hypothetical protein